MYLHIFGGFCWPWEQITRQKLISFHYEMYKWSKQVCFTKLIINFFAFTISELHSRFLINSHWMWTTHSLSTSLGTPMHQRHSYIILQSVSHAARVQCNVSRVKIHAPNVLQWLDSFMLPVYVPIKYDRTPHPKRCLTLVSWRVWWTWEYLKSADLHSA